MLLFYISLSVLVSFTCSLLEATILSVSPAYLKLLKSKNKDLYLKISFVLDDIEKPLASILTLNTIAHTVGAAGAGAEAQKIWGNEHLSLFSALLTFIILFFSEIIPKSIGARGWKTILPLTPFLLKPMIFLSYPIVFISLKISQLIKGDDDQIHFQREEIPAMAELSLESGTIDRTEYKTVKSLINFSKVRLKDILTPIDQVSGVYHENTIEEAYQAISDNTYSRLIVYGRDHHDIRGYVMRKDILQGLIDKSAKQVSELVQKILILPETTSGRTLFDRLLAKRSHFAAVINNRGDFIGIVTLEDLIETLMGTEIYDEFDQ